MIWSIVNLLLLLFTFFVKKIRLKGENHIPVLILCDVFTSPLVYLRLAYLLNKKGYSVTIFCSGSIFSRIADHAKRTGDFLVEEDISSAVLFAHGMAGLTALKLPDASRQRITHLVPIGVPFNGTRLLMFLQWIPALGDMAVGSEYILLNRTNAMLYKDFTPFSAWQDQTIIPFNLSIFGQGRDLILDQVGHYNLVLDKENLETICELVIESNQQMSLIQNTIKDKPTSDVEVVIPANSTAPENKSVLESPVKKMPHNPTGQTKKTARTGKKRTTSNKKKSGRPARKSSRKINKKARKKK